MIHPHDEAEFTALRAPVNTQGLLTTVPSYRHQWSCRESCTVFYYIKLQKNTIVPKFVIFCSKCFILTINNSLVMGLFSIKFFN